jgi:import inner membrane translocase subunit TIM9
MRLYNNLVQRCFNDCVDEFRSKHLSKAEEGCVTKCCEKFLALSARTGQRFQELFAEMEQKAAAAQQGGRR